MPSRRVPFGAPQREGCAAGPQVIMNYTAILLDRVEKKVSAWSHDQCLGDIFLKMVRCVPQHQETQT